MTARLLIIALDGADGCTLDWASLDGTLPHLAGLRARGHGWQLSAPPSTTDCALWANFQYGVGLSEHGRYNDFVLDAAGNMHHAVGDFYGGDIFWDQVAADGGRVAVLDIPKCRPPRPLNGIHLADWLVHGRFFQDRPRSYPPELVDDILERFGPAPPSRCGYSQPSPLDDAEVAAVRGNFLQSVAQKRDAGLHYLTREPWDLFMIGFKEAHCSCHMLWDFHDPAHEKHDSRRAGRLGDPVMDVLRAQDEAIGALAAAAGPEAGIIVFSTTDFAPNGTAVHLMPQVVQRINAHIRAAREVRLGPQDAAHGRQRPFCRTLPFSEESAALRVPPQPGDTPAIYRRRLALIGELARELVDENGEAVVTGVSYPAFAQPGGRARMLPHMLLHYRGNMCPAAVSSPRLGRIEKPAPHIRTGNHAAGGFAFAAGAWADDAARIRSMADFGAMVTAALTPGASAEAAD